MPDAPAPHPHMADVIFLATIGMAGEQAFDATYMRTWRLYDLIWQNDVALRILKDHRKPRDRCGKPGVTS